MGEALPKKKERRHSDRPRIAAKAAKIQLFLYTIQYLIRFLIGQSVAGSTARRSAKESAKVVHLNKKIIYIEQLTEISDRPDHAPNPGNS